MPLGVVSDDEFEKEIRNSLVELDNKGIPSVGIKDDSHKDEESEDESLREAVSGEIVQQKIGRGLGTNEVPESLRKIITQTNLESGRAAAISLAKSFDISESSVDAYLSGKTGTGMEKKDPGLDSFIKTLKQKSAKRASQKLLKAINNITDEKLEEAPAGVLAAVAKQLSGVVRDLEPDTPQVAPGFSGVQFVVYAPQIVQESKFDVIEVAE